MTSMDNYNLNTQNESVVKESSTNNVSDAEKNTKPKKKPRKQLTISKNTTTENTGGNTENNTFIIERESFSIIEPEEHNTMPLKQEEISTNVLKIEKNEVNFILKDEEKKENINPEIIEEKDIKQDEIVNTTDNTEIIDNNTINNKNNNNQNNNRKEEKKIIYPKESIELNFLKAKTPHELIEYAKDTIENINDMHKQDMIYAILKHFSDKNPENTIIGEGILEILPESYGFLRSASSNYVAGPDDIYVSPLQIKKFGLRNGDNIKGPVRAPRKGEKYFALLRLDTINGLTLEESRHRIRIDDLIPLYPQEKLHIENTADFVY